LNYQTILQQKTRPYEPGFLKTSEKTKKMDKKPMSAKYQQKELITKTIV
jgi:hypothetical protein